LRTALRTEQRYEFTARQQREAELEHEQERKPWSEVLIADQHADGERNQNSAHPQSRREHGDVTTRNLATDETRMKLGAAFGRNHDEEEHGDPLE
jgi:hypothetical protein